MTQEMTARLDGLDTEIKNLGKTVLRLRYEDLKQTFCEQMKRAVEDYSRFRLRPDVVSFTSCTPCTNREQCGDRLKEVVMEAAKALREDRSADAWNILDEAEGMIRPDTSPCQDSACTHNALIVLERAKTTVELVDAMKERLAFPAASPSSPAPVRPTPREAAAFLDPLSHPKRLEVLELLARGEQTFSEIGRAVGLKTGHLQFHLRPLLENELIEGKGRGRSYRLTIKGEQALAGVSELMGRVTMM